QHIHIADILRSQPGSRMKLRARFDRAQLVIQIESPAQVINEPAAPGTAQDNAVILKYFLAETGNLFGEGIPTSSLGLLADGPTMSELKFLSEGCFDGFEDAEGGRDYLGANPFAFEDANEAGPARRHPVI